MLSSVWLFATPWTVVTGLLCPWNFPGKNTAVCCHILLQGIFPTQGSNPCLLHLWHWQLDSLQLSYLLLASQVALVVKNPPVKAGDVTQVRSLGWEDPLEEGTTIHSSILAWRIPRDRGSWWAAVYRVIQSQTWLKRLSMQTRSVTKPCPTLCDPTNCSIPGFPVHHYLLEFA